MSDSFNKFGLKIAHVIRISVYVSLTVLVLVLIGILLNLPYSIEIAYIGMSLVVIVPFNGLIAAAILAFRRKLWAKLIIASIVMLIYIAAVVIAL